MRKLPTYSEVAQEELKLYGRMPIDRQNTIWSEKIADKCNHKWELVQMLIEEHGYADLSNARVYFICRKCSGHTYMDTAFVGYMINGPDEREEEFVLKTKKGLVTNLINRLSWLLKNKWIVKTHSNASHGEHKEKVK